MLVGEGDISWTVSGEGTEEEGERLESGKIREGWMYLKPIGDRVLAESLLKKVEVSENNLDEVIEISVSEGVAPAFGFSLVLEHYGTCNSITAFETQINHLPKPSGSYRYDTSVHRTTSRGLRQAPQSNSLSGDCLPAGQSHLAGF